MDKFRPLTEQEITSLRSLLYEIIGEVYGRGTPLERDPDREDYDRRTDYIDSCQSLADFCEFFGPYPWQPYASELDIDKIFPEELYERVMEEDSDAIEEYCDGYLDHYGIDMGLFG